MQKLLTIDRFDGGRNTRDAMNAIEPNQHSAGQDVWCENKALTKRRGYTKTDISVASRAVKPQQLLVTKLASSSLARLLMVGSYESISQGRGLLYTDDGAAFSVAGYAEGNATTDGTNAVVGAGTAWDVHVAADDYFMMVATGTLVRISAVGGAGAITLASAYAASGPGAYVILKMLHLTRPVGMVTFDVSGAQNAIIADGAHVLQRYNGTSVFNITGSPSDRSILAVYKNYVFAAELGGVDVRWSGLKDVTSWPSNNLQTVTNKGNPIRGMVLYQDALYVLLMNGMVRVIGDTFDPSNPTYVVERIAVPPQFLVMYPRTAVVHKGLLKVLCADGWYAHDGGPSVKKISEVIQTDVDGFTNIGVQTESVNAQAIAFVWKEKVWTSFGGALMTGNIWVLDENGAFWKWAPDHDADQGEVSDFAAIQFGSSGTYQLMGGNVASARIAVLDTGYRDMGADSKQIDASWESKEHVFKKEAALTELVVHMKKQSSGTLVLSFSIDRATYVDKNVVMTGVGTVIRKKVPIARIGKSIRVKVANAEDNVNFEIYRIEVFGDPTEAERA